MSKKMLLLSVPLALLLTACNGDDRRPTASLPNNPGQPTQPGTPTTPVRGQTVTATVNNDDLSVAENNGTKIATSSVSSLRATRDAPAVVATRPTVDVQFNRTDDEATLTVDGQSYQLSATGPQSPAQEGFSGQADGINTTLNILRVGNQQSALLAYTSGDATETRAGFASYGALTPENRVPGSDSATATYTGTTVLAVANQQRSATLTGAANVIANFGAGAADRFNGSTFQLGNGTFVSATNPNGGTATGGTLTVRDGTSTGSGNAFSAGLSASGFDNNIGSGASGSMSGNFFGDNAEEVAGTIAVSGGASGTSPGYTGIGGYVGRDAARAQPSTVN